MNIHGTPKTPTWTTIGATINVGDSSLATSVSTNWAVDDEIVIATTSFDGRHSEQVKIATISGTAITFTPALKYDHISVSETYGAHTLDM